MQEIAEMHGLLCICGRPATTDHFPSPACEAKIARMWGLVRRSRGGKGPNAGRPPSLRCRCGQFTLAGAAKVHHVCPEVADGETTSD